MWRAALLGVLAWNAFSIVQYIGAQPPCKPATTEGLIVLILWMLAIAGFGFMAGRESKNHSPTEDHQ